MPHTARRSTLDTRRIHRDIDVKVIRLHDPVRNQGTITLPAAAPPQ